jgi:hypothetical protein
MKRSLLIVAGIFQLFFSALAAFGADTPNVFVSQAGRFSVAAPVEFAEQSQSVETQVGTIEIHMFVGALGDTAFVVSYCDYPEEVVKANDPKKMLDGSRDGCVANVNGKLALETLLSLEGNPGRELVIDITADDGGQGTVKSRLFLVSSRLYQLIVVAPKGKVPASVMDDFLQSLKLLAE